MEAHSNSPASESPPRELDLDCRLLRVTQVAEILAISRSKVYTMIDRGLLPVVKIDRATRISLRSVREFVDALEAGVRP